METLQDTLCTISLFRRQQIMCAFMPEISILEMHEPLIWLPNCLHQNAIRGAHACHCQMRGLIRVLAICP